MLREAVSEERMSEMKPTYMERGLLVPDSIIIELIRDS